MKSAEIGDVIGAERVLISDGGVEVKLLLTDSRRLKEPSGTIFFAIPTGRNSGVKYIDELYKAGVRMFVVPADAEIKVTEGMNVWYVHEVVEALQRMAMHHRMQFAYPVIGITGSNGKTIVKDWLVQMLGNEGRVCASPKSYNSQIGVPLSVWQMCGNDRMAVFEAGISEPGEMAKLREVIRPTIGLITNVGTAHDENFVNRRQKIDEKLRLFEECDVVVYCAEHSDIHSAIGDSMALRGKRRYVWGRSEDCNVRLLEMSSRGRSTIFTLSVEGAQPFEVCIPFSDRASQENAMHCVTVMSLLGYDYATIAARCANLTPVEIRLELDEAVGGSILINDSYSLDINSLGIALDYMDGVSQQKNRVVVLSDFVQSGMPEDELYSKVASLLKMHSIDRMVGIGEIISKNTRCFEGVVSEFFVSTDDFIRNCDLSKLYDSIILLKGARVFAFERIAKLLQHKNHETVMEVNLDALTHNLNYYRSRIKPGTKLMAMVKAASYGAGRVEVAQALQYNHVDYLTVAYADEGVELRRGGIRLPIMVMNPEEESFEDIVNYRLEPDIYSFRIMDLFARCVETKWLKNYPIHVEFDTGMHRLGFCGSDVDMLTERLAEKEDILKVQSVFTHLACAEDPAMDAFTQQQISNFESWSASLPGMKHILNSSGITRFPQAQHDMVRLGIGLYGISPEADVQSELRQVSRLVTRISQIKDIPEGDTVGYNCRWRAERKSRIAIITIGYADGLHRGLGYGRGRVEVAGTECPIIGSVCMDMCFIDVTDVDCHEGDRVVIFGNSDLLQRNATAADTIPYELLTAVSPRVKRVYYHEE